MSVNTASYADLLVMIAALKEEFAAFKLATAETAQVYIERIDSLKEELNSLRQEVKPSAGLIEDIATYVESLENPADARAIRAMASENERLKARVAELEGVVRLALEYWQHRQQRYKNRFPSWVVAAKEALKEPVNEG